MKIVIAFDVDGTLECGSPSGPLGLEKLRQLKAAGLVVGIVGAYEKVRPRLPDLDFYHPGDPHKPKGLKAVKERFKPTLAMYIADRPSDRETALRLGFIYVRPEDFTTPSCGPSGGELQVYRGEKRGIAVDSF